MINPLPGFEWRPGLTGIFSNLDSDVYHRHTPFSGLSRSIAEKIVFESPAHAKEEIDNPKEATKFMNMGSLVHCGTLEPRNLAESYYVRPDTRPAEKDCRAVRDRRARPGDPIEWDGKAGYCKTWIEQHSNRPIISAEDERNMLDCINALKSNPTMAGMLKVGQSELSVFAEYDGVLVKCRPDLIAVDGNGSTWVLDIKKCQNASEPVFRAESRRAHRDFQEAWYRWVLGLAGIRVDNFVFAGVEEGPPHGVGIYRIANKNVEATMPKIIQAVDLWRQCQETGEWPGYTPAVVEIGWAP
jgi:hypothetical protein